MNAFCKGSNCYEVHFLHKIVWSTRHKASSSSTYLLAAAIGIRDDKCNNVMSFFFYYYNTESNQAASNPWVRILNRVSFGHQHRSS